MDEITIRGYKSIRDQTVEIRPINVLIGGNGGGKSNFISFFSFLNALYQQRLATYVGLQGGPKKIVFQPTPKQGRYIDSVIVSKGGLIEYSFKLQDYNGSLVFLEEKLKFKDNVSNITSYERESGLMYSQFIDSVFVESGMEDLMAYHFHDTGPQSPFYEYSHIPNDTHRYYSNGKNIAAFLWKIRQYDFVIYKIIVKVIKSIAPFFRDFYLELNEERYINLLWQDKYSDNIYGASDFSDGTMRFVALTVLFLQPDLPQIIIIDEPELGLHPVAIAKLAGMIKQASQRGSKVIVATQSTALVNHFEPEDVITVDNVDGASQFNRLRADELEQWLEDYTLGDLWSRNIIQGGQP